MSVVKSKGWKEYAIYSDKMRVLTKIPKIIEQIPILIDNKRNKEDELEQDIER